jgi:hypothetical protein
MCQKANTSILVQWGFRNKSTRSASNCVVVAEKDENSFSEFSVSVGAESSDTVPIDQNFDRIH